MEEARKAAARLSPEDIVAGAETLLVEASEARTPGFIADRIGKLRLMIDMISDTEWRLPHKDATRVLNALAYFSEPEDLIPDTIPGLGFLDDAIYAEMVIDALSNEITLYEEFCHFRHAEEARRKAAGEDIAVGREDWLKDKRSALHAKMHKRRMTGRSSGSWSMRLW